MNYNITQNINNKHLFFDKDILYANKTVSFDIIKENISKFTDFYQISRNPNITWDIINENNEIQWNFQGLSANVFTKSYDIYLDNKLFNYNHQYN